MSARDIPWCVPDLSGREVEYVTDAVASGHIGPAGPYLERLERQVAEVSDAACAVTTCCGTDALHLALLLAGVRPGDEVVVPALTFVATANAVRHLGAYPVVVDIDPEYWQIDPCAVAAFLTGCEQRRGRVINPASGRRVAAVVPVHLLGHPAPLAELDELAQDSGIAVVADGAQGLGATYRGCGIASGGVLTSLSFNANKIITTGGGGAVLTGDPDLAARARYLGAQAASGTYQHDEVGHNWRMSNVSAAIGCAQVERLADLVAAKRRIHDAYSEALVNVPGVSQPGCAPWATTTRWFAPLAVDPATAGIDAAELRAHLASKGVSAGPVWTPLHQTRAHAGCAPAPCPVAERLGRAVLQLPCSPGMTEDEVSRTINAVRTGVRDAARGSAFRGIRARASVLRP
ncbi:aminotransferase class I/II-fold pyridoxal phosphate-dependent enzyme [Streptomyces sp. NPDC020379]|uniref:aminotransferase class I/II-fold pyridoxal phosphate-dependent enzyme n=1 Tax=Streptomyces sp. NPDC020379 TaxID=3365071 RepID=UPI0037BC9CF2